jgi:hypothetical protein
VSPHVPQELQPLDNPIVEINQFGFSKPINVDPHGYSRSHRCAVAVNIQELLGTSRFRGHAGHPLSLLIQTGWNQSRGAKDCENANHIANSINNPVRWFDKFAKILAWPLWYVSAHQRESFQSVDRSQNIFDDDLSVVRRVASDEIINGLEDRLRLAVSNELQSP